MDKNVKSKNAMWEYLTILYHGKNNFAEVSKNWARYRSENNFVRPSKYYVKRSSIMLQKVLTF